MSILDSHGNLHNPAGRFTDKPLGEGEFSLSEIPAVASPTEVFDTLDAGTRLRLRTASVTLPSALATKVTQALRAEGVEAEEPDPGQVRALGYAQFAFTNRDLVGLVPGWGTPEYLEMSRPWREAVGELHPDDEGGRPWWEDVLSRTPGLDEDEPGGNQVWEAQVAARTDATTSLAGYLPDDDVPAPF